MTTERDPDGQIRTEKRGRLLLMCIDRPEKLNGWTPKMFAELTAAYTQMDADPEVFCGLVYAEGKHFTAGLDMPKVAPLCAEGRPIVLRHAGHRVADRAFTALLPGLVGSTAESPHAVQRSGRRRQERLQCGGWSRGPLDRQ